MRYLTAADKAWKKLEEEQYQQTLIRIRERLASKEA